MECYTHARLVPLLEALLFEPVATGVGYGTCPVVVSECGGEGASDSLQRRDARVTTWTAVNLCDFYIRNLSTFLRATYKYYLWNLVII